MDQYHFFRMERHASLPISYSTEAAMCLAMGIISVCVFMYLHIVENLAVNCISFPQNWGGWRSGANGKITQMKERTDIKYWNKKLV